MYKSRFTSLMIVLALIGTTAFTFQNSSWSAQSQSSVLPGPDRGAIETSGPNPGTCFTASFPAASDCDRLASGGAAQPLTAIQVHRPTLQSCFSRAYHAGSDCDRLASMQGPALMVRNGPTSLNCFSEVYHAASDCDRLALDIR